MVLVVPSVLGVLPTITQPLFSMVIAVVRPTPPGHCARFCGTLGEQRRLLGGRVVVDDRRAGALQVGDVVEIVDQHVVLLDLAGRDRRHHDRVGIEVAIVRHRRGQGDVPMDGFQEALAARRACARAAQSQHERASNEQRGPQGWVDLKRPVISSRSIIAESAISEQDIGAGADDEFVLDALPSARSDWRRRRRD